MRRPLITLVLVLVMVLNACAMFASPSARAQEATPGSAPGTSPHLLDLPAMVLRPDDIPRPDFGIRAGAFQHVEDIAAIMASQSSVTADEILAELTDAGLVQRYYVVLDQAPQASVATPAGMATPAVAANVAPLRVETAITEYASPAGAATGFALLEQTLEDPMGLQDVPLETPIGDEAEITLSSGLEQTSQVPYQSLNVTFRTGRVVADLTVVDFTNQPIDQAEAEALAATLQERVAAGLDGQTPGLSTQVARSAGTIDYDGYFVIDHEPLRSSFESDEQLASFAATVAGVRDVYTFRQWLGDAPYLDTWLYGFASSEEASAWLEAQDEEAVTAKSTAMTEVQEVTDAPAVGESSRAFSYTVVVNAETTAHGYVVFFQVGSIVARVGIDTIPETPLSAVMEFSQAQAACLEQGGCAEPVAIPAELLSMSPAATPVPAPIATPVAIEDPGLTGPTTFAAQDGAWQITWDPAAWTVGAIDRSDGEVISLASTRETSASVQLGTREGYREFGGDAETCQEGLSESAATQVDTIRDFAPVTNAEGTPVVQGDEAESSSTWQFVESFDDGTETTFSATFWCRTVVPGETVLAALITVDAAQAEVISSDVDALLDGVIISPEGQE